MADAQTSEKVAAAPEVDAIYNQDAKDKQVQVAAPVSSKKQSLSDIFTIVRELCAASTSRRVP